MKGFFKPFFNGDGPHLDPLLAETEILDEDSQLKLGTTRDDVVDSKKNKVFTDIPLPPPSSPSPMDTDLGEPALVFVKERPPVQLLKTYELGLVRQTKKEAVVKLAEDLNNITIGNTGAIIEEGFLPIKGRFREGFEFEVEKSVSKGSFGATTLCYSLHVLAEKKPFIRKKIEKEKFRSSEVVVPTSLNHENLTKFYGLIQRKEANGNLTVELMIEPAGDALNTFTKDSDMDDPKIWNILKQIIAGLNHLHLNGMIHFDIKPDNICVQIKKGRLLVKIIDFGSAKLPQNGITFDVGMTPEYMAPETCKLYLQKRGKVFERETTEHEITGKVDVFAVALVIMFLYEDQHVLQLFAKREHLMLLLARNSDSIWPLPIPRKCDIDMRELLRHMLQYDHNSRYTAQNVMNYINERKKRREEILQAYKSRCTLQTKEKESSQGPVRTQKEGRTRETSMPYAGKGKGKFIKKESPMQEMRRIETASKSMMNVNTKEQNVIISQSLSKETNQGYQHYVGTFKPTGSQLHAQPVTQPSGSKNHAQPTSQPAGIQFDPELGIFHPVDDDESNVISLVPVARTVVEQTTKAHLNQTHPLTGKLEIVQSEKGPMIVEVPEGNLSAAPTMKGAVPLIPAPVFDSNYDDGTAESGNMPDFTKLFSN